MLRRHQSELAALCRDMQGGLPIRQIIVSVTPGGGKSLLPVILTRDLLPRLADAICWVVPRRSLQEQAEQQFIDPAVRRLLGSTAIIRISTNDADPCRGREGFVTTYQAISADPALLADEFRRKRYILFLDEPHHVAEGGQWHRALQPLVNRAALVILASGTFARGDDQPIAFLPYRMIANRRTPDLAPAPGRASISYTRSDALGEQAIKPLRCYRVDGRAEWIDRDGRTTSTDSLATTDEALAGDAIYTAVATAYATQLLDVCVRDWTAVRARQPRAKLLIVAATIALAQDYQRYLRQLTGQEVGIATSDDSQAAITTINRFKRPSPDTWRLDILVTVAMAYEGLDVPPITHLALLTRIRSRPWIEQAITRAARVDRAAGPYITQFGFIYGPDDPLLRECFDAIAAEQLPFLPIAPPMDLATSTPASAREPTASDGRAPTTIIPIAGELTRSRAGDLATGENLDYAETAQLQTLIETNGLAGTLDPITLRRMIASYTTSNLPPSDTDAVRAMEELAAAPPSVRERALRSQIERTCRAIDLAMKNPPGTMSRIIVQQFGKQRTVMTERELIAVDRWLRTQDPRR